jgi:hypothetical protein
MRIVPPPHPAGLPPETLLAACHVERSRGSGPGGQHRNKVETTIRLHHQPTGIRAGAGERRQQAENLGVAVARLRLTLAIDIRCERDLTDTPSALWRSRLTPASKPPASSSPPPPARGGFSRLPRGGAGRIACNPRHTDYPTLLAEALDVLWLKAWDPRPASLLLLISPTQLVKFIAKEPAALVMVNRARADRGDHPLKA